MNADPKYGNTVLPIGVIICMAALNVLALGDFPYGYYQVLRLANTAFAIFLAYHLFKRGNASLAWASCFVAMIFNPLLPIHLDRSTWHLIDLAAVCFFAFAGMKVRRKISD